MTGTPIENNLLELWSQFDFVLPGMLGDKTKFTKYFRQPIEKANSLERKQALASWIPAIYFAPYKRHSSARITR